MTDVDYFRRRENQERQRAALAKDFGVRAVHLDLAERYAVLAGDHQPAHIAPERVLVRDAL